MARRVFFSFHYQDVVDFRANVVRQHWRLKPDRQDAGFFDASLWETARRTSDVSVKRLINEGLDRTTVTCVLIGTETWSRRWVRYEIVASFRKGSHILGVNINGIKGKDGQTKPAGRSPFEYLAVAFSESGLTATLYEYSGDRWLEYEDFGTSATYQTGGVAREHWGRTYKFSEFCQVYDWAADDGYRNFASWVHEE